MSNDNRVMGDVAGLTEGGRRSPTTNGEVGPCKKADVGA